MKGEQKTIYIIASNVEKLEAIKKTTEGFSISNEVNKLIKKKYEKLKREPA